MAVMLAGLFALDIVLDAEQGAAKWAAGFGLRPRRRRALRAPSPFAGSNGECGATRTSPWGSPCSCPRSRLPRAPICSRIAAALLGLTGIAYLAQGWIAGTEDFTDAQSNAIVASWVLGLASMVWLRVAASRKRDSNRTGNGSMPAAA